jgi:hypothetical protein
MDLLVILHARFANAVIIYMLVMGVWGLINFARRQPVSPSYFGALVVGEILIVAQALAGIGLYGAGLRAAGLIHYLYGATTLISLPAAYVYVQGDTTHRATAIYALVCLFVFGLGIRGVITAGV